MAQYSKPQLEQLWAEVNPGTGNPHLMAAIAMAESSGNSGAVNSIGACGLWQIYPYEAGCINPVINARMAGEKLRGQGLDAWETYTNGSYSQYLTGTSTATGGGRENVFSWPWESETPSQHKESEEFFHGKLGLPTEEEQKNLLNPAKSTFAGLGEVAGLLGKLLHLLTEKDGWIRLGKVLVGLFLLLVGVLGLANVTPKPAAAVAKTTKKGLTVAGALL